jgi:hypothetical protein
MVDRKLSSFAVALIFAVLGLHFGQSEHSAVSAQQHNQTDLDFTRERASVAAADQRINSLRKRLAALSTKANQASSMEQVLVARDAPPPQTSGTPSNSRAGTESAERDAEHRIPSTLRHRDRSVSATDVNALKSRLNSAQRTTRSLGERVNRPDFGAGLQALDEDLARIDAEISNFE